MLLDKKELDENELDKNELDKSELRRKCTGTRRNVTEPNHAVTGCEREHHDYFLDSAE